MADAVASGHDCPASRVRKGFEGPFNNFRAMTFVEPTGVLIQDIGAEIKPFCRIGALFRSRGFISRG